LNGKICGILSVLLKKNAVFSPAEEEFTVGIRTQALLITCFIMHTLQQILLGGSNDREMSDEKCM
jgi:hypothetical protein